MGLGAAELVEALELIEQGRCEAAIPLLRRSHELGRFQNALWNLAECYRLMGRPRLSMQAFQAFIDLDSSNEREEAEARAVIERLRTQMAQITVNGNVEGARITVDGQREDDWLVPMVVLVGPGDHAVQVTSPGFSTWHRELTTGEGEERVIEADLRPLPGEVSISSDPEGAEVWLDGEQVGEAPWDGSIPAGIHMVQLRAEGRRSQERRIVVERGQRAALEFTLPMLRGSLAVAVNAQEATLAVDGEPRGSAPFAPIQLTPGRHLLEVTAPRYAPWSGEVDVLDGRATRVEVDLASRGGLHPAWFWSLTGLTLALAATGTTLVVLAERYETQANGINTQLISGDDLLETANLREHGEDLVAQAHSRFPAGIALLGVGAGALLAAVLVGVFTRFREIESRARVELAEESEEAEVAEPEPTEGGTP